MTITTKNEIINLLELIPGISGFSPMNKDGVSQKSFLNKDFNKAISYEEIVGIKTFNVSVSLRRGLRVKTISHEICSSLKNHFKKSNIKCDQINIYVDGIN